MVAYSSGDPIIGDYELQNGGFIGGVYGLQRTGRKGFQWGFIAGPGIDFEGEFAMTLLFKLGFVLGKSNKRYTFLVELWSNAKIGVPLRA